MGDAGVQFITTGEVDWGQAALAGGFDTLFVAGADGISAIARNWDSVKAAAKNFVADETGLAYNPFAKNAGNEILALPAAGQSSTSIKADFYVTPGGDVIPATGYRYMDSKYAEQTMSSMSAPGSYFGFEKFDSASAARDAYQVAPHWSNCRLRGEFDTLQVIDGSYVPRMYGDKGVGLEPFTKCYPEYGKGGYQQYICKGTIKFSNVTLIGE